MEAYFLIFSFNIFADFFFFFYCNVEVFSDPVPWKTFLCKNSLHWLKKHMEHTPVSGCVYVRVSKKEGKRIKGKKTTNLTTRHKMCNSEHLQEGAEIGALDGHICIALSIFGHLPVSTWNVHMNTCCEGLRDKV